MGDPILNVYKNNYEKKNRKRRKILAGLIGTLVIAPLVSWGSLAWSSGVATLGEVAPRVLASVYGVIGLGSTSLVITELIGEQKNKAKFDKYESTWGRILDDRDQHISSAVAEFSEEIGFDLTYEGSHFPLKQRSKARLGSYNK